MYLRGSGATVRSECRYESLSQFIKMVCSFQRILARQLPKPDNKAAFQAEIQNNIHSDTSEAIIVATHRPNRDLHEISTSVNSTPIHFLRSNYIDKDIMTFEDTSGGCKCLFSYLAPVFFTCHTARFPTIFHILLTFGPYNVFRRSWNHMAIMIPVAVIYIYSYFSLE